LGTRKEGGRKAPGGERERTASGKGSLPGTVAGVQTTPRRAVPGGYRRPSWRRPLTVLIVLAVLLGGAVYAGYTAYQHFVTRLLTMPGCQAGFGANALPLDFVQASDAAIIAGVAERIHLPRRALIIAYATALQESKLENLSYGDLDSVGVFQQRPSEGWGSAAQLENPEFAATAFFNALVKVPRYTKLPVYQAAQDVQHSADGYAYQQYAQTGAMLAADFTATPHAVTCWYDPVSQAASNGVSTRLNLPAATRALDQTFGRARQEGPVLRATTARAGKSETVGVTAASGWAVANWLLTNASSYGITQVRYAGYRWTAGLTETSWQTDPGAGAGSGPGSIVAS
jgi:hypothetical protein